jgi:microcystin-dependent protein
VGWTAQSPNLFQELATLIASLLSGSITASFLTGQVNGSAPASDIGPWANGDEWWFWDVSTNAYQPSQQGCPIGTVMMWGTRPITSVPPRWLLCKGQGLPIATYPRLYTAIGDIWGTVAFDGVTFYLPPPAVLFLNGAGFTDTANDPNYNDSNSTDGQTAIRGGSQTAKLVANQLPAAKISIPLVNTQQITGNTNQPNIQTPGSDQYLYPVTDENGNPLGTGQQVIPVMPPFVVVHYVIKYM